MSYDKKGERSTRIHPYFIAFLLLKEPPGSRHIPPCLAIRYLIRWTNDASKSRRNSLDYLGAKAYIFIYARKDILFMASMMRKKEKVLIPADICITCGETDGLILYQFDYRQSNFAGRIVNVADIAFSGINLIIGSLFNKRYLVFAKFCPKCGGHLERLGSYHLLFGLAAISAIILFGALAAILSSLAFEIGIFIFAFGFLAAIGIVTYSRFFIKHRSPKIESISASEISLEIRGKGMIRIERE